MFWRVEISLEIFSPDTFRFIILTNLNSFNRHYLERIFYIQNNEPFIPYRKKSNCSEFRIFRTH